MHSTLFTVLVPTSSSCCVVIINLGAQIISWPETSWLISSISLATITPYCDTVKLWLCRCWLCWAVCMSGFVCVLGLGFRVLALTRRCLTLANPGWDSVCYHTHACCIQRSFVVTGFCWPWQRTLLSCWWVCARCDAHSVQVCDVADGVHMLACSLWDMTLCFLQNLPRNSGLYLCLSIVQAWYMDVSAWFVISMLKPTLTCVEHVVEDHT